MGMARVGNGRGAAAGAGAGAGGAANRRRRRLRSRAAQDHRHAAAELKQRDSDSVREGDEVLFTGFPIGEVLGVINMVFVKGTTETVLTQPSGIAYAVPSKHLRKLIDKAR
jgi:hypothetical protein